MTTPRLYLCVQSFAQGVESFVRELEAGSGVASIDNPTAVASYRLGNFATVNMETSAGSPVVSTEVNIVPDLDGPKTFALVGLKLSPIEKDMMFIATATFGNTSNTAQSVATFYGTQMSRQLLEGSNFTDVEDNRLLGAGLTNLIFHNVTADDLSGIVSIEFTAMGGGTFDGKQLEIGSVFVGHQITLYPKRESFNWSMEIVNDRQETRAISTLSSDGVLRRSVAFEAIKVALSDLAGISASDWDTDAPVSLFRAAIANVGQPMLVSPFPYPGYNTSWPSDPDPAERTVQMLSRRQNFYSVYGLFDRRQDISIREFNDGLDTDHSARLRFTETR